MRHHILARLAVLSLISLTGACSVVKSYLPADTEAEMPATTASEVEYALPRPAPAVRTMAVSDTSSSYVTQYDSSPVSVPIKPGAPTRYTVVRGDTLWDISGMYLDDPWLWPEIWQVNPQIDNPHLIYPGDVLSLVWVDGRPQLRLERDGVSADVRLSPQPRYQSLDAAIKTIPYDVIASFLSKPRIIEKTTARNAPYVLDIRESHLIAGAGFHLYVRGTNAPVGSRFYLYNIGDELYDPDTGRLLGYEGAYIGEGRIEETGDPSLLFLTESRREALKGDILLAEEPELPLNFHPRAPQLPVEGRIISVVDGVALIGNYQIVSLNIGASDGLEVGHVLSVFQTGKTVVDRYAQAGGFRNWFRGSEKVTLPDRHAGELLVFRVENAVAYGLIMDATSEIKVLDNVRNPEN